MRRASSARPCNLFTLRLTYQTPGMGLAVAFLYVHRTCPDRVGVISVSVSLLLQCVGALQPLEIFMKPSRLVRVSAPLCYRTPRFIPPV